MTLGYYGDPPYARNSGGEGRVWIPQATGNPEVSDFRVNVPPKGSNALRMNCSSPLWFPNLSQDLWGAMRYQGWLNSFHILSKPALATWFPRAAIGPALPAACMPTVLKGKLLIPSLSLWVLSAFVQKGSLLLNFDWCFFSGLFTA